MSWYHMSVKREPELGDASKDGAFLMWKISQSRSTNMIPNIMRNIRFKLGGSIHLSLNTTVAKRKNLNNRLYIHIFHSVQEKIHPFPLN